MGQKGIMLTVCFGLIATTASGSLTAMPPVDFIKAYQLKYQTYHVNEMALLGGAILRDNRVRLLVDIIDGGCITDETITIKSVESITDSKSTVINLLYTLEGQPGKKFFAREVKAVMRLPVYGMYRIKFWINELYFNQGEVLLGEKVIQVE